MKQVADNLALQIPEAPGTKLRMIPPGKKNHFQKLALPGMEETRFIAFQDIIYCQSVNNYTTIITRQGRTFTCCKTLKDVESRLPADQFIRIHASYLVNMQDITALKKKRDWEIEINNELLLPVSRLKKEALQIALGC